MHLSLRFVIVLMTAALCYSAYADEAPECLKAENGFAISWKRTSKGVTANQIKITKISDEHQQPLISLNLLRVVPTAMGVTAWDVSARGDLIAIAAIYKSKDDNVRSTATLLLFNFKGELLSASALAPTHTVRLLEIDDDSNIWTFTNGAGKEVDPSTVSTVVEYSSRGKVLRELLPRSTFPLHARDTKEDVEVGWPSMGSNSGLIWLWLPGSTDLVTISTVDGQYTATKTGLPAKPPNKLLPLALFREESGHMLMQVAEEKSDYKPLLFTWSASKRSWSHFKPSGCEGGRLIGISENQQVYFTHVAGRTTQHSVCVSETPIPTLP